MQHVVWNCEDEHYSVVYYGEARCFSG